MSPKPKSKAGKSRLQLLHQYYSYTGFYKFVGRATLKAIPVILIFVGAILAVNHYFDIGASIERLTEILPLYGVLGVFFLSESVLGLIPPEMFIAWAGKMYMPWLFLGMLATLSYCGGLISYWLGRFITRIPRVHNYLEYKWHKQLRNSRKWGGFLILVGALLPLPFSIACMTAGIIKFSFRHVMLYGAMRFVRFAIYGYIIFSAI